MKWPIGYNQELSSIAKVSKDRTKNFYHKAVVRGLLATPSNKKFATQKAHTLPERMCYNYFTFPSNKEG